MPTLLLKPVEAMHMGGPGEFSPAARGPAALGRSLTALSPTTVVGLLAHLISGVRQSATGSLADDYSEVARALASDGDLIVRGPYLVVDGDLCFSADRAVINVSRPDSDDGVYRYAAYALDKALESVSEAARDYVKRLEKRISSHGVGMVKLLGVGLERDLKTSDENRGLLYLAEFVDHTVVGGRHRDTYIAVDLIGNVDLSRLREALGRPVRLGGESRVALLLDASDVKDVRTIEEHCRSLSRGESGYHLLIHVTPAVVRVDEDRMYVDVKELEEHLFGGLSDKVKLIGVVGPYGRDPLAMIGLGFNEVKKVRRPLRIAVASGSISIVKCDDVEVLERVCREGVGDGECDGVECRRIGFGTVVPIARDALPREERDIVDLFVDVLEAMR